ncbi:hypothetical protein [Spirosoma endbachense]|uniref:Nuclear transport factor 2 family protein n=1 Tax=Spirosoma endbachense TaxID=2666025 RepID=A0A6P1VTN1_9BACT|nr:hypothetical protein [Spirosoma endbachense]QHV95350.1 hypothetical protein GJR95_10160 [Spirosoma endbachense]
METSAKLLEDSLLVIWNDRNTERRLEAMNEIYAVDIIFYETNEGQPITGYQAINELISGLQTQWPSAFKFELTGPAKVNHQVQHIAWRLGVPGQAQVATGMDVAIIDNHKIKSLHLFLDAPEN